MILKEVEREILSKHKKGEWILPFYDKWSLSNIPATVHDLLGLDSRGISLLHPLKLKRHFREKRQNVILLLLDGFGYDGWLSMYKEVPFLRRMSASGTVLPVTSVFPSTTAASVTTLQTGVLPIEHGLFEWFLYFKEFDQVAISLRFQPVERQDAKSLSRMSAHSSALLKHRTIYETMKRRGVRSFAFHRAENSETQYNLRAFQGSKIIPYRNSADFAVQLRRHVSGIKAPTYTFAYWGDIDSLGHTYGPGSDEWKAGIRSFFSVFEQEFVRGLEKKALCDTVLIMTADHGMLGVNPERTAYLDGPVWLKTSFQKSTHGRPILPCGNFRDVFLHIAPDRLDYVRGRLSRRFGAGSVRTIEELIRDGFFGNAGPSREFIERAGNLVILPSGNGMAWFRHQKKNATMLGHHGGLRREEMLVPFAIARLSNLV